MNNIFEGKCKEMEYVSAFIVGGLICVAGQILMDTTKLTPEEVNSKIIEAYKIWLEN